MKLYKTLIPAEVIKRKQFPCNTVIAELNTGVIIACSDFAHSRKIPLLVTIYMPNEKEWVKANVKNELTEKMWDYYRQTQKHNKKRYNGNYTNMMKHSRRKKTGGSGSRRENKRAITDYECSKNPLHDFRRVYI